jgi:cytochrome P450
MGMGGSTVAEPVAAEMMSHGSLNTAGVLCNVLAQLARHPHIQTKVHNEISTISGLDKSLTETDVQKMIYLNATVLEAARLLPTAPFLQRCSDEHDIALLPGVVIPAGAILTAPIQLIQRDTVYWGDDAAIFNPDRFLKPRRITSGELASEQNQSSPHPCNFTKEPLQLNPAFLVFGAGSRSCIGSSLAVKQISILVTVILKRFELKENFDSSDAKAYENMSRSPPRLTLSPR